MRLIVDMDDTIVSFIASWLTSYNRDYNDTLTRDDIKSYQIQKYVKHGCGHKIFDYLHEPNIYLRALPYFNALGYVKELSEVHDIWFATKGPWSHDIWRQKYLWLKWWLPGLSEGKMVYIMDKSLLKDDVMIDDYYENLKYFDGKRILVDRPHNHNIRSDRYERMDWDQIFEELIGK